MIHTKLRNRLTMKNSIKWCLCIIICGCVRNLTYKRDQDDCYNPIDLNHVFNDDDILDAWIQEREQLILRENDLH